MTLNKLLDAEADQLCNLILKQRKKGDNLKAKEIIIVLALLIGIGYAIYDQIRIIQELIKN